MRSFSIIAVLILVLSVCLFGCSSDKQEETTTQENGSQAVAGSDVQEGEAGSENASTPEGTSGNKVKPSEKPEQMKGKVVIGKIKNVAGNQVTLEVAEMPENMEDFTMPEGMEDFTMPEGGMEGFTMPEGMTPPDGKTPPEGFDGEFPGGNFDFSEIMNGDFTMPDFGDGGMPQIGGMPEMNMEDIELTYTGETAKYTIPIGVKVGSGDYTSLSKGMVIMLNLDDNNVVSSVMIISQ